MERVKIKARDKKKSQPILEKTAATIETSASNGFATSIAVRYGTSLHSTIQNMIETSHVAQDFTFVTPSDFVRAALEAYRDGMQLTELDVPGEKREVKIRVHTDLRQFYETLPKGMRTKIVERAIRTYMKQR